MVDINNTDLETTLTKKLVGEIVFKQVPFISC